MRPAAPPTEPPPAPSVALGHPSARPGCGGSGTALLSRILRAPNTDKPEPKNTAQGPERACRAGNGVCTVEHRSTATSNGNGTFAPAIPDPKGSGDEPGARRAAELTGGRRDSTVPDADGTSRTGCRQSTSTQHPADPAEPEAQHKTEAARPTASTSPSRGRSPQKGKSLSGKSRGRLMLSSSQADRITQ